MKKLGAAPLLAVLVPAVLAFSAVSAPLRGDDFVVLARLSGLHVSDSTATDLYRFATGGVKRTGEFVTAGWFPWWTHPDLKLSLFRPLTSALMTAEHRLFGLAAPAYHIVSLGTYLLVVLAAKSVYDVLLSRRAAALALLAFAIDDAHWESATWFSNQHACLAGALGLAAIMLYKRLGPKSWAVPAILAVGLMFGETAVQAAAVIVALAFAEPGGLGERAARLTRTGLVLGCYLVARHVLGYGAEHTGAYVYAPEAPLRYARIAVEHVYRLLAELVFGVPSGWRTPFDGLLFVLGTSLPLLIALTWRRLTAEERRLIHVLAFATSLSLLPVLAAPVSGRLLLIPGVGFFAVLGLVLDRALTGGFESARDGLRSAAMACTLLLHYGLAPALFVGLLNAHGDRNVKRITHAMKVPTECTDPNDVLLVRGIPSLMGFGPWQAGVRLVNGSSVTSPWVTLATTQAPLQLDWVDDGTFFVSTDGYPLIGGAADGVFTDDFSRMSTGRQIRQNGISITVTRTQNGYPTAVKVAARRTTCLVSFSNLTGEARALNRHDHRLL